MPTGRGPGTPGAACPSCDRFIGPADRCPYCGAEAPKQTPLRVLRVAALVLALAGLAFLYLAAYRRDLPLVRIGDVTPLMNFAYVRLQGTVAKRPYVARDASKVAFVVDDGTGRLRVEAYDDVARALVEDGRVPAVGGQVDVPGSLSVSADGRRKLYIRAADQVNAIPP